MDLQLLEIAMVNLKDGIEPTGQRLITIFRTCIEELAKAGGKHFRFVSSSPTNHLEKPIITIIGIWPTAELHAAFLAGGALLHLMASLQGLITMRQVVYLRVPNPTPAQEKILEGDFYTALFYVGPREHDEVDGIVKDVIKESGFVTGWNTTQGENFQQSEDFRRGRLEQDKSDVQNDGIWSILLPRENSEVIDELKGKTAGKFERVEVLAWVV
ncbi:uncharacterized protein TRUGW13939_00590 [Talaromyces rugulosus]|uniref:ABM domain-containing protein n=1 Tax=Talaromyces rugulosus TaxID=121627 RepID=A0A7H8QIZ8_TALRU|nr:uncharacterized protein TRUGW13939_00590 [Talaromyces rugulosus]QKX53511.1 hypothetical protein TRUGW13939_00590 [Talaromyces rugulosus]